MSNQRSSCMLACIVWVPLCPQACCIMLCSASASCLVCCNIMQNPCGNKNVNLLTPRLLHGKGPITEDNVTQNLLLQRYQIFAACECAGAKQAGRGGHADKMLKAHSRDLGQRQQLVHAKLHQGHPPTKSAGVYHTSCCLLPLHLWSRDWLLLCLLSRK